MKKAIICSAAALVLVFFAQPLFEVCRTLVSKEKPAESPAAAQPPTFEEQLGVKQESSLLDVTLYFRFGETNLLGACSAQLDMRREETVAASIVQSLLDGPDAAHDRLTALFPQGTTLIGVASEGATAFVTLSEAFLGIPDGAPSDWEDSAAWQKEATLRRRMAFESIVLALTEEGRYQRVQLYVAGSDDDIPQRIPLYWFDQSATDINVMLAPCARDENAMLTPQRTLEQILEDWQKQDWGALYTFLLRGEEMPTLSEFEEEMRQRDVALLSYELTSGTVSLNGETATVVLNAQIDAKDGGEAKLTRESVPLVRQDDNWCISRSTLESLMVRD